MDKFEAHIKLTFTEPLLGSAPLNKELYTQYIEAAKAKRVGEIPPGDPAEVESIMDEKGTGFHRNESGIFLFDYVIKGFFKEVGNTLKTLLDEKAVRSKLDNYLFITPRRIPIMGEDGKQIKTPHGVLERPLRAQTAQGPRVCLAISETVNPGSWIQFDLLLYPGHPLKSPKKAIREILEYGRIGKALGQWRNGGYGKIEWECAEIAE